MNTRNVCKPHILWILWWEIVSNSKTQSLSHPIAQCIICLTFVVPFPMTINWWFIDCIYPAHFVHTVTLVWKSVHRNNINISRTWVISMSKNFPYFLVLETVESTLLSILVFEILQLKSGGPWWKTLYIKQNRPIICYNMSLNLIILFLFILSTYN